LHRRLNGLHAPIRIAEVLTRNHSTDITAPSRLRIGEWWADPLTNELGRDSETVRIEPKAMEVLMVLVSRPGGIATREELLSKVWSGVVVGDEALSQSINKLRRAFGDNPRSPRYIETISKRGYRLIAPVRRDAAAESVRAEEPVSSPQPSAVTRNRGRTIVLVVALAVLAASVYLSPSSPVVRDGIVDPVAANDWDTARTALVTVTVLPFESLGSSKEQAYLARGISNDLMTDLARLSGLRVISAPSTELGAKTAQAARYLIAGSVQRDAEALRINVRLIDAQTKEQLWSERFERPFDALFGVQDKITRSLVERLPAKVSEAERRRLAKRYTQNLEAYDYFLRGQALFLARRSEDNEQARTYFRRAIDLDAKFARAYASLAMTYAMDYRLRPSSDASPALARAFELAETARMIDPDIPEIHWALGFIHVQSRRHEDAIESLGKALALDRSYADAYALMGGIYTYTGQPLKAIPLLRTAMRLNPDGGYLYYQILGRAYFFENDIEQAIINLREAAARNPVDLETRVYLAAANVAAGNKTAAEWEAEEIRALDAGFSMRRWFETYPMTSSKHKEKLSALLASVGL
jgi:DNA-binding winged helix-turn-helix (wHTH) protein/TolB-like protein/Tfp pilus assembly protein PilF